MRQQSWRRYTLCKRRRRVNVAPDVHTHTHTLCFSIQSCRPNARPSVIDAVYYYYYYFNLYIILHHHRRRSFDADVRVYKFGFCFRRVSVCTRIEFYIIFFYDQLVCLPYVRRRRQLLLFFFFITHCSAGPVYFVRNTCIRWFN